MKIHQRPIVITTVICFVLLIFPVACAGFFSNGTYNPETFSPTSQYSLLINPVTEVHTGQSLEIAGVTNAPEGSPILITGESVYSRMHRHQKYTGFTHDTFVFQGKIQNITGGVRFFSASINTSTLRPDAYLVFITINSQSIIETKIYLRPGMSQQRTGLIIDPPRPTFMIGESIPVSGFITFPDVKTVYAQIIPDTERQNASPDYQNVSLIEDFPLKEKIVSGYPVFEGSIGTTGLYPGNYTLQVASFDDREGKWFVTNESQITLTKSPIPTKQQKSGSTFIMSTLLVLTAMFIVTWQQTKLE